MPIAKLSTFARVAPGSYKKFLYGPIRFRKDLAMFATFDDFYESIAEVQWIDGRPSDSDVDRVLKEAWNFLSIEEQILENDIDAIDDDDEH